MHVLFEEAGKFLAGRVMSEAEASSQVELDSGKRVKVKAANVLLKFEKPAPAELLAAGQRPWPSIELELAWEFAPDERIRLCRPGARLFQRQRTLAQQAGALFRLFEAPHYFRRAGKGRFKKAPAEIVQGRLLAASRRKRSSPRRSPPGPGELAAGQCPAPMREQLYKILFKPDKNGPEYKAVVEAVARHPAAPLDLLQQAGAIDSPTSSTGGASCSSSSPRAPASRRWRRRHQGRPAAGRGAGLFDRRLGHHRDRRRAVGAGPGQRHGGAGHPHRRAGPGHCSPARHRPGGAQRLSTVYMPGYKITMLPDEVVQAYTLMEGRDCPAVSLYVTLDEATLEIKATETKLERVPIAANLRHDQLDAVVTEAWLENRRASKWPSTPFARRAAPFLLPAGQTPEGPARGGARQARELQPAGLQLPPGRQRRRRAHRGRAVQISTRQRGAPLDLIVAEAMILANSTWGGWLAELGVPGIYRSQASLAPGVKVRMGTKALPHAGMGVKSYAWSTSPLRRYTDLVNQWQIIACARHGKHGRAGRAVQAQGRRAVLHHQRLRRRLQRLQRLPGRHGALLDAEIPGAATASPSWTPPPSRKAPAAAGLVRADSCRWCSRCWARRA
jgi:exoribonuclease-2